jgi:MoaA/NifB/PqqE/SkfB family radical SAM enzyme
LISELNSNLFKSLRDTSRVVRRLTRTAYALTGDYFAEDPCCVYHPPTRAEKESRTAQA